MGRRIMTKRFVAIFILLSFGLIIYKQFSSAKKLFSNASKVEFVNRSLKETLFIPISNMSHQITLAVVISLAKQPAHIAEFYLLYESWKYIQTFSPWSDDVQIDLIVFCEQPSCFQLPLSCLPLSTQTHSNVINKCYYEELKLELIYEWRDYLYMTSIAFMLTDEYRQAVRSYQWILRVDQDAILSPALYLGLKRKHSTPLYKMQFGSVSHGTNFTHDRLKSIAAKLGYKHAGVHNLCSTWLVNPNDSIQLANLTTRIGKHFMQNEFGKHVEGIEDLPDQGEWPKWWRGVISLYAAEIAINHFYFHKITREHGTIALDHPSFSNTSMWLSWHIHSLHNPERFSKFKHRNELNDFLDQMPEERIAKMISLQNTQAVFKNISKEYDHFRKKKARLGGTVTVRDYVTALAWQKAYSATGAINF